MASLERKGIDCSAFIIDLDGCIYRGDKAIEGAAEAVDTIRANGKRLLFLTNNSTKTPSEYAAKLSSLGIKAHRGEILTSSVATAHYLKSYGKGRCYVIGQEGLLSALKEGGFELLDETHSSEADYVVCGLDMGLTYAKISAACFAIQKGAKFIATNPDPNLPVQGGYLPGAGSIMKAVQTATGRRPIIIGKPSRIIMDIALEILKCPPGRAMIVGDTLKMDIQAGKNAGMFTALVLTGSTTIMQVRRSKIKPDLILEGIHELSDILNE
uniref:HAD-IIA family hydrolase n=1 Tax=Candidatus Methanomethylicus mesodigestus TaxID=1867258 RepID=A0A7C3J2E0_9CREN